MSKFRKCFIESIKKNKYQYIYVLFIILWLFMIVSIRNVYPAKGDLVWFQTDWWNYIKDHGFSGIKTIYDSEFLADYTSIWYFIIYIFTKFGIYPGILTLSASIKSIAVLFTIGSSIVIYFIVDQFYDRKKYINSLMGGVSTLLIPPFLADILKTNLTDSSYMFFALLALLCFFKKKRFLMWFFVGVGIYFKAMAIYVIPFFAIYYLFELRKPCMRELFAPVFAIFGFIVTAIPGMVAGLSFLEATFEIFFNRSAVRTENGFINLIHGGNAFVSLDDNNYKFFQVYILIAMIIIFLCIFGMLLILKKDMILSGTFNLLIIAPMICWLCMPAQRESYFALSGVFSLIVFSIYPTIKRFIMFVISNLLVWLSYLAFIPIFNSGTTYMYIMIAFIIFVIWDIFTMIDPKYIGKDNKDLKYK
ncbi:hypothetical protein RD055328_05600 [Companilactobacillus sp. RD055328]|uniref:hypothetical protein n=1 Tax=Companilactobacillus sp. RD055328 TaxID=2916634 RepID=UPI001FC86FD6|nr:hypothetical protein [Companilactobacillus sp. RD055328]GKQ42637.1 hypothetical protein RD055328_05600 [Companilactobacillus sp. RD055328]